MPADELMELQLPHSVMAEQSVLGSMLIDERCVPAVMERLRPDDFYLRQNRALFDVMFTMFNRFETIDPVTVVDRMKQAGAYDDNTVPYLRQLMEITPTAANVLEYVDIVADKALLRRVGEKAAELGAVPAAVTFDTHPENLILKTPAVPLLSSPLDRAELMRRFYGIREVIVAHFDERMMHMPWREFVTDYLAGEHGAVHLVAGHDFHFGYKGEGNPERLQALCGELGIGCDIIPKVVQDHITISSTYIRTLVAQGEMERANQFLGHPHTLTDTVAHGKKLGGTLGFPTVNLRFQPGVLVPAHGVYATRVTFENGESRPAVTNIGVRPTVDDGDRVTVEGFILDFQGDLYGQTVRMEFYKRLRGERKFPSLEALKDEVMRNAEQTRAYFSTQP